MIFEAVLLVDRFGHRTALLIRSKWAEITLTDNSSKSGCTPSKMQADYSRDSCSTVGYAFVNDLHHLSIITTSITESIAQ